MSLGSPSLFYSTSKLLIRIGPSSTGLLALDGHHNSMGALEWGSKPSKPSIGAEKNPGCSDSTAGCGLSWSSNESFVTGQTLTRPLKQLVRCGRVAMGHGGR